MGRAEARALDALRALATELAMGSPPGLTAAARVALAVADDATTLEDVAAAMITAAVAQEGAARIADAAIKTAQADKKAAGDIEDRIRAAIATALEETGAAEFLAPFLAASLQPGKPGVVITDAAALPDRFVRTERAPNKSAIAEALTNGEAVEGAAFSNSRASLRIRARK